MKVMEMSLRYRRPRRPLPKAAGRTEATEIAREFMKRKGVLELQEVFCVMPTDNANNVLGIMELSRGTVNATVVDIRLLMATCLLANAVGFICVHNHPSGNLKPSRADELLTKKINEAAETLNLRFLDHIIITKSGDYSFQSDGRM